MIFVKKIFVLFLAICLCFCGCVSTEPQIDPNLIKIEITYSDSKNITFDVVNNSKDGIEFGSEYHIEYLDGEEWVSLEERTETFFTMIAHVLASGKKMNFSFDIAARYGELSSGTSQCFPFAPQEQHKRSINKIKIIFFILFHLSIAITSKSP